MVLLPICCTQFTPARALASGRRLHDGVRLPTRKERRCRFLSSRRAAASRLSRARCCHRLQGQESRPWCRWAGARLVSRGVQTRGLRRGSSMGPQRCRQIYDRWRHYFDDSGSSVFFPNYIAQFGNDDHKINRSWEAKPIPTTRCSRRTCVAHSPSRATDPLADAPALLQPQGQQQISRPRWLRAARDRQECRWSFDLLRGR